MTLEKNSTFAGDIMESEPLWLYILGNAIWAGIFIVFPAFILWKIIKWFRRPSIENLKEKLKKEIKNDTEKEESLLSKTSKSTLPNTIQDTLTLLDELYYDNKYLAHFEHSNLALEKWPDNKRIISKTNKAATDVGLIENITKIHSFAFIEAFLKKTEYSFAYEEVADHITSDVFSTEEQETLVDICINRLKDYQNKEFLYLISRCHDSLNFDNKIKQRLSTTTYIMDINLQILFKVKSEKVFKEILIDWFKKELRLDWADLTFDIPLNQWQNFIKTHLEEDEEFGHWNLTDEFDQINPKCRTWLMQNFEDRKNSEKKEQMQKFNITESTTVEDVLKILANDDFKENYYDNFNDAHFLEDIIKDKWSIEAYKSIKDPQLLDELDHLIGSTIKISDEDLLSIARGEEDIFSILRYETPSKDLKLQYLPKIVTADKLRAIIKNDSDFEVKLKAITLLDDTEILLEIFKEAQFPEVNEAIIKKLGADTPEIKQAIKIKNDTKRTFAAMSDSQLAQFIISSSDLSLKKEAFALIADKEITTNVKMMGEWSGEYDTLWDEKYTLEHAMKEGKNEHFLYGVDINLQDQKDVYFEHLLLNKRGAKKADYIIRLVYGDDKTLQRVESYTEGVREKFSSCNSPRSEWIPALFDLKFKQQKAPQNYLFDFSKGENHIGGEPPKGVTIPTLPIPGGIQYLGYVSKNDEAFSWLGESLYLFAPIFQNFHQFFVDYTNPKNPQIVNGVELIENQECSYDNLDENFEIVYEKKTFSSKRITEVGYVGVTDWVQSPEFPKCPKTDEYMKFVCKLGSGWTNTSKRVDKAVLEKFKDMDFWGCGALFFFYHPESKIGCYIIQNS